MVYQLVMNMALMTLANLSMEVGSWQSINDGVMGGLSAGGMVQADEGLVFAGRLSLENNGGFSSVRRSVTQDLSNATGVRIEVRGDDREYQFRIHQDNSFDGVAWRAMFSSSNEWREVEIPLNQFIPVFRGRTVPQAGPVVPSRIDQIGFLLADKNVGQFELQIRRIEFYGAEDAATDD